MTESKDKPNRENIFELLDGMMFHLSKTKQIFMIMILTTLIIPPIAIMVATSAFDSPFHDRFEEGLEQRLEFQLRRGQITPEQYQDIKATMLDEGPRDYFWKGPQMVIFALSLGWLAVGIRQWIVLSKWDKRYKKFKEEQKEMDKALEDDSDKD